MSFTFFTLLCIFCSCFVFVLKDLATIPINPPFAQDIQLSFEATCTIIND